MVIYLECRDCIETRNNFRDIGPPDNIAGLVVDSDKLARPCWKVCDVSVGDWCSAQSICKLNLTMLNKVCNCLAIEILVGHAPAIVVCVTAPSSPVADILGVPWSSKVCQR